MDLIEASKKGDLTRVKEIILEARIVAAENRQLEVVKYLTKANEKELELLELNLNIALNENKQS